MVRRSLSTNCCHCGSGMRLIYQCKSQQSTDDAFRLRAACPVCSTNLVIVSGGEEVYYDEARLTAGYCRTDAVLQTSGFPQEPKHQEAPRPVSQLRKNQRPVQSLLERLLHPGS